ncbi:hypothetical protein HEP74_03528 [Xanthomonas sp. SS]|nr:hypothetical protein HEP74_03528 [Xanthomonas sp. SS]
MREGPAAAAGTGQSVDSNRRRWTMRGRMVSVWGGYQSLNPAQRAQATVPGKAYILCGLSSGALCSADQET